MTSAHNLPTDFCGTREQADGYDRAGGSNMSRQPASFGRRVRALRLAVGLTQAELAEASGISERTVSDLERGLRSRVYPATARRLAAALRVSGDQLTPFLLSAAGGGPGIEAAGLAGPLPAVYRSRLPPRPTRLIGRGNELASTLALVHDPGVHLVTVLGPGGVGKTRLATEIAAISQGEFGAGSWFVDLSVIGDATLVLPAIASSIGVRPEARDLPPLLASRIGAGKSFMVLDTFEHLLPAGPAIAELAASCPGLTVLVTSRSVLNVRGEREVPLRPLAVRTAAGATTAPAAELFLERARAVAAELAGTATLDAAAEICARLDGLPLAIELAAARTRHMPVTDVLVNLDHRLDLLVGGARDLPARQQAMRTALDWSYALLDGPQMRLFRGLSVFSGSFSREAARVIAVTGPDQDEPVLLSTLGALVDASLVTVQPGAGAKARYRLLELVREYAAERAVAAGELESLRQRHASYFLTLAERAEPELRGSGQQAWFSRLLEDEGNFRAALTWALAAGQGETALRLAGALWMFWRWAGLFAEGQSWLTAALAAGQDCPPETRLQGLWGAGWLAFHQGDYQQTSHVGQQMLRMLASQDERLPHRNALTLIGIAALAEGRTAYALDSLSQALGLCEGQGTTWHLATSLLNLGMAQLQMHRGGQARELFIRALSIYRELGDKHFTARVLTQLGHAALADGQPDEAAVPIRQAIRISAQISDAWSIAESLHAVANLRSHDAPETAVILAAAAGHLREQISMRPHPADEIIGQHHLKLAQQYLGQARSARAWARGRQITAESALAIAIAATGTDED
jgi:predicted ATPase/transcriptional regulator with XRE-family HTH domain